MLSKQEQIILTLLENDPIHRDVEIVTVEIIGAKKSPIIRVYIDVEGQVSFNELSDAQEWIGTAIEELDPFPGAYTLEISSPGIDRPLRTIDHFKKQIGNDVRIRCIEPIDASKNFKGRLVSIDDDGIISIEQDNKLVEIELENIKKANLIGKIEF